MTREEFVDIIYYELQDAPDNYRANRIIDAFDEYISSHEQDDNIVYTNFPPA